MKIIINWHFRYWMELNHNLKNTTTFLIHMQGSAITLSRYAFSSWSHSESIWTPIPNVFFFLDLDSEQSLSFLLSLFLVLLLSDIFPLPTIQKYHLRNLKSYPPLNHCFLLPNQPYQCWHWLCPNQLHCHQVLLTMVPIQIV